jgi:hypothetical protein
MEISLVTAILYCIALVKVICERKIIRVAFYIFLVVHLLDFLTGLAEPPWLVNSRLYFVSGVLLTLSSIFLLITCFLVKNQAFEKYFKFYACSLTMVLVYNIGTPIFLSLIFHSDLYYRFYRYLYFIALLPIFAMTYIIYKSAILFKPVDTGTGDMDEELATY